MTSLASYNSPQIQLVHEFTRGFDEADVDILAKHLHKDFRRSIHPKSLGLPELTRDEWLKNMGSVLNFTTELKVSYHLPIYSPKASFLQLNRPRRQLTILSSRLRGRS